MSAPALITNVEFRGSGLRLGYMPELLDSFGIDNVGWKVLVDSIFPDVKTADSIIMALTYCRKRSLDIFKRPVHIVPMWSAAAGRMIDTVWPSIAELRTTAFRTGLYAGRDGTCFGPDLEETIARTKVKFPEWAQITVYRLVDGVPRAFPGPRVYWRESYAWISKEDHTPNAMWCKRPHGQLEKCAEAASLRGAFPEEIGGEYAAEEMEGQRLLNDSDVASGLARRAAPPAPVESLNMFQKPSTEMTEHSTPPKQDKLEPPPTRRRAPPPTPIAQRIDFIETSSERAIDFEAIRQQFSEAAKAAQSSEDLGEAWNRTVEPYFDRLMPPDQEDLLQISRLRAAELPDD